MSIIFTGKEIQEFREYFPQGKLHQIYKLPGKKVSRVNVPIDGLKYLAQHYQDDIFSLFSEIEVEIDPNFAFIYYKRYKFFSFSPLTLIQKKRLEDYNEMKYRDWLIYGGAGLEEFEIRKHLPNYVPDIFNPLKLIKFKTFQKGVKICKRVTRRLTKYMSNDVELPPFEKLSSLLNEFNKVLNK